MMMKHRKPALFCGLILCVTVLFTACGNGKADTASPTQDTVAVTSEEAKSIALSHGQFSESDVRSLRVEKDDNGRCYDVSFLAGDNEYDYEIDAETGTVISYECEAVGPNRSSAVAAALTEEEAKAIALNHAGFSETEVTWLHVSLDNDDGHAVYEVEFREGNTEYEYTVDADSGDILSYDADNR